MTAFRLSETAIKQADESRVFLENKIHLLESEIVEHMRPADELNEDLHKYLGHNELHLAVKDTEYVITRHDIPAESLSEGETTAIALLYFLKSLEDRRFDLKNGLVMLDDPVSSLDANSLYLAFGLIRERTQHAGQIFILTHNFTFFRQVRNWFHNLKGQKKKDINKRPARFYMLDCTCKERVRCSNMRPLDPLLERFESEYQYLFARIYKEATESNSSTIETNLSLPNIARRLVEAFLAFRQPQIAGELRQKFDNVNYEEAKKLRILRFLHTYSHGDAIEEPAYDLSLLSESHTVLMDLLDFIKDQDPTHYNAMVTIVTSAAEEGEDE